MGRRNGSTNGYVKQWRQTIDGRISRYPQAFALWNHLLLRAAYRPEQHDMAGEIPVGHVFIRVRSLAREVGMSYSQLRKALDRLITLDQVSVVKVMRGQFGGIVISIVNWSVYQKSSNGGSSSSPLGEAHSRGNLSANSGNNLGPAKMTGGAHSWVGGAHWTQSQLPFMETTYGDVLGGGGRIDSLLYKKDSTTIGSTVLIDSSARALRERSPSAKRSHSSNRISKGARAEFGRTEPSVEGAHSSAESVARLPNSDGRINPEQPSATSSESGACGGNGKDSAMPRKSKKKSQSGEYTQDFLEFWEIVHLKVAKLDTFRAWKRAVGRLKAKHPLPKQYLKDRMMKFRTSAQANPKTHTPIYPSTWLNKGRYDDDDSAWEIDGPIKPTAEQLLKRERR